MALRQGLLPVGDIAYRCEEAAAGQGSRERIFWEVETEMRGTARRMLSSTASERLRRDGLPLACVECTRGVVVVHRYTLVPLNRCLEEGPGAGGSVTFPERPLYSALQFFMRYLQFLRRPSDGDGLSQWTVDIHRDTADGLYAYTLRFQVSDPKHRVEPSPSRTIVCQTVPAVPAPCADRSATEGAVLVMPARPKQELVVNDTAWQGKGSILPPPCVKPPSPAPAPMQDPAALPPLPSLRDSDGSADSRGETGHSWLDLDPCTVHAAPLKKVRRGRRRQLRGAPDGGASPPSSKKARLGAGGGQRPREDDRPGYVPRHAYAVGAADGCRAEVAGRDRFFFFPPLFGGGGSGRGVDGLGRCLEEEASFDLLRSVLCDSQVHTLVAALPPWRQRKVTTYLARHGQPGVSLPAHATVQLAYEDFGFGRLAVLPRLPTFPWLAELDNEQTDMDRDARQLARVVAGINAMLPHTLPLLVGVMFTDSDPPPAHVPVFTRSEQHYPTLHGIVVANDRLSALQLCERIWSAASAQAPCVIDAPVDVVLPFICVVIVKTVQVSDSTENMLCWRCAVVDGDGTYLGACDDICVLPLCGSVTLSRLLVCLHLPAMNDLRCLVLKDRTAIDVAEDSDGAVPLYTLPCLCRFFPAPLSLLRSVNRDDMVTISYSAARSLRKTVMSVSSPCATVHVTLVADLFQACYDRPLALLLGTALCSGTLLAE
ncbi:hypothetical protein DIPPA_26847 [Diplonema papillatum]|nr:hypothetical protein DIPPA_26847 [Diplonema papillatum]